MAIGTDAAIDFFGAQDTLGTSSASVANGVISLAGDLSTWTNDDDAREAAFVLEFTTATTGTANTFVDLYCRLLNVGDAGTEDEEAPDVTNFLHKFVGSFPHNNPSTSAQTSSLRGFLPNTKASQEYEFYIVNNLGQTISAGWDLHVTPVAVGPHL